MNNRGNIMLSLLFFIMALGVMIAFISPLSDMIDIAQQSDNLNCRSFVFDGNTNHTLSFNTSINNGNSGSPLGCLAIKLYLPYILLTFLIGGISAVLAGKTENILSTGGSSQQEQYQ